MRIGEPFYGEFGPIWPVLKDGKRVGTLRIGQRYKSETGNVWEVRAVWSLCNKVVVWRVGFYRIGEPDMVPVDDGTCTMHVSSLFAACELPDSCRWLEVAR